MMIIDVVLLIAVVLSTFWVRSHSDETWKD